eukprot:m.768628 g.768628  ORF g.768628 m.768628 type:complete len:63 (-) comp59075_c0_seq15:1543-1731(-)
MCTNLAEPSSLVLVKQTKPLLSCEVMSTIAYPEGLGSAPKIHLGLHGEFGGRMRAGGTLDER